MVRPISTCLGAVTCSLTDDSSCFSFILDDFWRFDTTVPAKESWEVDAPLTPVCESGNQNALSLEIFQSPWNIQETLASRTHDCNWRASKFSKIR